MLQKGLYIYLGSRNIENGIQAVKKLKSKGWTNLEAIEIDVTSDASVAAARKIIGEKTEVLDILINNAGISGGMPQTALGASVENQFKKVYETNVFGVVRVTQAFLSLMEKSDEPRIVNVSSSQGSITA